MPCRPPGSAPAQAWPPGVPPAAAAHEGLPVLPPADPPQRPHLPALQGQVSLTQPKEAQAQGWWLMLECMK